MNCKLRIAMIQMNATVGDLQGNRNKILEHIQNAEQQGADLIVFPEMALCGYPPEDLLLKKHFVDDIQRELARISARTHHAAVILGTVERGADGRLYNAAAILQHKKQIGTYRKVLLPNYGVFDEKRYFSPGVESHVLLLNGVRVGISICEDIWPDDGPAVHTALMGHTDLLINISASPYHQCKGMARESMLVARAKKTKNYVCYVNLVGGQDELVFDGDSLLVSPSGKILARGHQFEESLVIAEIPSEKKVPQVERLAPVAEVYSALVLGVRDYVRKNGFKKVLLGLSGGIDSALTAALAVDALGAEQVVGVSMPSMYSSAETQADAEQLAENLAIEFKTIPISDVYLEFLSALRPVFSGLAPSIAEENLQARIRGMLLMAMSNKFGWMLLSTGNKSEVATGYCTLYGDMAGGFNVLKDVPKTLVYQLAKWRNKGGNLVGAHGHAHSSIANQSGGGQVIPESTIRRAPTAELKPNQTDQDTLPPYDALDKILNHYVEADQDMDAIVRSGFDTKTVQQVIRLVDQNEYKRRQSAPGVKISPKAFGKDRRMPITNQYRK